MKKLGINTISNVATKLWSMVSIYLFIPLYIKILGETTYGLVSFFATLQTALNILGLGLSNTLRREFASGVDSNDNAIRKYKLLRSIENIYFVIAIVIALICGFGARGIAEKWLNIENLDVKMVTTVIFLMGCSIALQLICNLYAGCLFGLDKQVLANCLCIAWSAAKSIGSLAIIAFVAPNLVLFYEWHIFMDMLYLILLRFFVKKKLYLEEKVRWELSDFKNMKTIWKYTCGILFISFIVLINKELDKVIISKYLTLTELGAYNVATTLGSLSIIVPTAVYTTVFPRFTNYATTKNGELLTTEFLRINKFVGLILSAMGAYIAVYALPLIRVWTGSDSYAEILGGVGAVVVLAVAITEYQEVPYALALANGNTKYNVIVGGCFIPVLFIVTYFGIINYGLWGAGIVYLTVMTLQTLIYEFLIYKRYLKCSPIKLIIQDMVLPLSISLIISWLSKKVIEAITCNVFIESIYAVFMGGITLIFLMLTFAKQEILFIKRGGL